MGIPSYFSYIVKNHSRFIKKLDEMRSNSNNLFLDSNSIIYDVVRDNIKYYKNSSTFELLIIKEIFKKIVFYIQQVVPNNIVYVAFDGVAPVAKLRQQRNRRYKSWFEQEIMPSISESYKLSEWDKTAITPGSSFMNKLSEKISKHFANKEKKYKVKKILISTSEDVGEGEHKIFEYIRDNALDCHNSVNVIYGLDADLIMLCINHLPVAKDLYLFRETPHFIKNINSDLSPNESYIIDIPELAIAIMEEMNNKKTVQTTEQKNRLYDYIFLCFFLGNDFMPHFPSINIRTAGIDILLNAYRETIGGTKENLTDGKSIYWKNVRKFIKYLSEHEQEYFREEYKRRNKFEKRYYSTKTEEERIKKFQLLPIQERCVEKYINPYESYWEYRYYKMLFFIDINEDRKREICINYLEALEWNMKYYTNGCINWRWCYKYDYAPLLCDLIKYTPYFDTPFFEHQPKLPVCQLTQLAYVLPKNSIGLLPLKLQQKLLLQHPEWYSLDCKFKWSFCKYFWESHVDLPEINLYELEDIIKQIK